MICVICRVDGMAWSIIRIHGGGGQCIYNLYLDNDMLIAVYAVCT